MIALLGPRAEDRNIAEALVESTAGCGREQEVAALLPTVAADTWSTRGRDVVGSVARVLERRGRVEEAMALLRAYVHHEGAVYHDVLEGLADMLVRHDRWDELRELPECDDTWVAWRMADALEEQGRVAEAVEALRPFVARGEQFEVAARSAELSTRLDRIEEAIEVLRVLPTSGAELAWVVSVLWTRLVDLGRVEEAFAFLDDDVARRACGRDGELFLERVKLLAYCGRKDEAIAILSAHPKVGDWYLANPLGTLLADAGRVDEAIAVLTTVDAPRRDVTTLASLLIGRGRVAEAITTALSRAEAIAALPPWTGTVAV
ncbi:tetratricopeptide repeat protein [Embleya sp. NPDC059259]|uniref:tetratricopeptide repeat protein n=1 Tax=unclassified Embleya TaxID=2699296 RepID=UPI0036A24B7C